MTAPYPEELRQFGGEVVAEGVRAPGSPVDPEADARGGGVGTGETGTEAPDLGGPEASDNDDRSDDEP